jgi:hypothetical protein
MKKLLVIIVPFLSLSCTTQPEGCGTGYLDINGKCFNQGDLSVLQNFIDNSSGTIKSSLDTDSSGIIEPLELAIQKWNENGRLTYLWLKYDSLSGEIPRNIGELTFLDTLNLGSNQLSGTIPESIGRLSQLNWLYFYLNQLSGVIPDSICTIYSNLTNTSFAYNQFCPPYPGCISIEKIAPQDTSNCP